MDQIKVMIQYVFFWLTDCGLTMVPNKLYVKFGDSASIDCSTTVKDVDIMSWEAAVGSSSNKPPTVTWMVDKLEDFTMEPKCYVTLKDGRQCILKSDIILYSEYSLHLLFIVLIKTISFSDGNLYFGHIFTLWRIGCKLLIVLCSISFIELPDYLAVSAVGTVSVAEGKEHQLQCDMYGVAPAFKLSVKWYKDNTLLIDGQQSLIETLPPECFSNSFAKICNVSSVYNVTAKKSDNGAFFKCKAEFEFGPAGPQVPPSMSSKPYLPIVHCRFFTAWF